MNQYTILEERGNVLIITINRPEKKNALNSQLWLELCESINYFEKNDDLIVAILTNAGDVFCAGSDLKELAEGTYHAPEQYSDWGFGGITRHFCPKPIIAAVNGRALGGGAEMALAADLCVMTSDGAISFPEIKRALLATGGGALLRAGRALPIKRAMELMLTGDPISAETAYEWGLVNALAEPGHVLDEALKLAERITCNGPLAIKATKRAIYECMDKSIMSDSDGWDMMMDLDVAIKKTRDAHEGEVAFAEKREPRWEGR